MNKFLAALAPCFFLSGFSHAEPISIPESQATPLPDHQVTFQHQGVERFRWHHDSKYPRPFFHPFCGPSGALLTRMGHPGAPNHDHHRSIWFAHHDVNGEDFWSENGGTQIWQKQWLAYHDSDDEAIMASLLGWYGKEGTELMEQEMVAALLPMEDGEYALEFQLTFRPPKGRETVDLGKTNFGFLAVRVAKTISAYFGGGTITCSEGNRQESSIFGKAARWMDYSGPVPSGSGENRTTITEGITFFDHPSNPRYPSRWHVREDGWMGASFCMSKGFQITSKKPLVLRYLLHSHSGKYEVANARKIHERFTKRPGFKFDKPLKHGLFEVLRK